MSNSSIPSNERVAVFLHNGTIIEGFVLERTERHVRPRDTFEILEEKVTGPLGEVYGRGLSRGRVKIPFTSISHWMTLTDVGLN
ncbi:MAG: hypothetical protein JRN06_04915 [Nitrososphaerota archaeon]|nr:hypothetical protein [Nitrososphaerota archaeon]MDG7023960.1 hypothetical protein [Nitrososphaerota archaeon]